MNKEHHTFNRSALAAAVALTCVQQACAVEFETDGGWKGNWNTTISAATAWRAKAPDNSLIGPNDAAVALGYAATAGTNAAGTVAAMMRNGSLRAGVFSLRVASTSKKETARSMISRQK